jgi:hypothetical protein
MAKGPEKNTKKTRFTHQITKSEKKCNCKKKQAFTLESFGYKMNQKKNNDSESK